MTAADRAVLTDALTAASAGPSPPPIARLRAAAEYVIDRARPDQMILFGSASRGEFDAGSDFDFLVVRRPAADARPTDSARWTHPETGDEMDVLFETPELAAERRWRLGTPHSVIFAEGATVHAAPGATPIRIRGTPPPGRPRRAVPRFPADGRSAAGVRRETRARAARRIRTRTEDRPVRPLKPIRIGFANIHSFILGAGAKPRPPCGRRRLRDGGRRRP